MEVALPIGMEQFARQQQRLLKACEVGWNEPDVVGMGLAGSFADGKPDAYSDLDVRMVLANGAFDRIFPRRLELARNCGPLLAAFTGEHVGEPNLLITLYEDLVHVDYLFAEVSQTAEKNEGRRTLVLWQRDDEVVQAFSRTYVADPVREVTYAESRIWTWVWYVQTKILRGELWEAVSGLNSVRDVVLFRLLAIARAQRYRGARYAEESLGEHRTDFARTLATIDQESLLSALRAEVDLYLRLADPLLALHGVEPQRAARDAVLSALDAGLAWRPYPPS